MGLFKASEHLFAFCTGTRGVTYSMTLRLTHITLGAVGYNPNFDLAASQFDVDLAFGHEGEDLIKTFVSNMCAGNIEVKTDRFRNGKMVVETQQHSRHSIHEDPDCFWKLSGINVTMADWWVYVFSLEGSFIVVKVARLKKFLRINKHIYNETTKILFAPESDNPAKGWLIQPTQVIDLLINPVYD